MLTRTAWVTSDDSVAAEYPALLSDARQVMPQAYRFTLIPACVLVSTIGLVDPQSAIL
jgi:hypothetical protein